MYDLGIFWNVIELCCYIFEENFFILFFVCVEGFLDIWMVFGSELIEVINDCYG